MDAVLPCRRAGDSIEALNPQAVADYMERALATAAVPHVALIGWKRWADDGWVNGSTFVVTLAVDASRIDPETELLLRGLPAGFTVVRCFAETRASLMAKPAHERKSFRWYFAELLKFERKAAGLPPFDAVDIDWRLDNFTADHRFSRD